MFRFNDNNPSADMNIHAVYGFFQRRFRPKRVRELKGRFPLLERPTATILDVGGVASWWAEVKPASQSITVVNLDRRHEDTCTQAGITFTVADGRSLPFADRQFDLAHSNSVIEHVGSLEDQRRFASELLRCGKAVYMQTPNRWFPVEPHLIAVFIHWLPFNLQRRLVRWFSVWGWVNKPSQAKIDEFLAGIRLLTRHEVVSLFPGCQFQDEMIFGLTKSFVAVRPEFSDGNDMQL
jgi:Methyltransferase domain